MSSVKRYRVYEKIQDGATRKELCYAYHFYCDARNKARDIADRYGKPVNIFDVTGLNTVIQPTEVVCAALR